MYRDRGVNGSKPEASALDRKRINNVLDRHLERASSSTTKGLNGKEKERLPLTLPAAGKRPDHRDQHPSLSKNKCSEGLLPFYF